MPMKDWVEISWIISSETSRESVSFHFPVRSVIPVGSRRSTSVAQPVTKGLVGGVRRLFSYEVLFVCFGL